MKYLLTFPLLLLALLLPATALAYDFEVDGIYYNRINSNKVEVTYKESSHSQYSNEYSGSVTIPATVTYNGTTYTVTSIGIYAFYSCSSLTTVNIPNSVTNISNLAFTNCSSLTAINIPNSVTAIGESAFAGCESLTSINIPNSVTQIGESAFNGCSSLTNINIPNSITTISFEMFYGCSGLTTINIPNSVTSIGDSAFEFCFNLTTVNISNSVTSIGNYAFVGCESLTSINIPNSVTQIGGSAFWCCYSLTNINIPNSVTEIGGSAFSCCFSLTTVNIPNSVTTIYDGVFAFCESLTSINIPNSVTHIYPGAFIGCSNLKNINIGNSVTKIGGAAFDGALNNIYCYAVTPPECDVESYDIYDETFNNYSATLHVPAASLAAYFTAPVWCKFENIVGDAIAPTGITISKDSVDMSLLGEQIELTATVTPANASCKEVTWYSTDTSVAMVENGVVTAVGYGECDIYAYCMGMPAICHVSVSNRISLEQNEAMLLPNHMLVLNPTAPAMPAGFTVTSSDPTVAAARVMNGKVQIVGIKEGTTRITVASTDGTTQPATCIVTVYTESGDTNCDGFVNISDVTLLIDYLLGNEATTFKEANADFNADSSIDIADVTTLIDHLLSTSE